MPLILSPTQLAFNARGDGAFNKPFKEQIDFFRQKINLPTAFYDDIIKSAHDRAFMVAGAAKADLLDDFRQVIDQSIAEGKSIGWFRKEFDGIVEKHGWAYNGERDWRTRVIYTTNIRASYAAGRYAQLTDPDLLKVRPYWKYVHNDTVAHPRPLHQSWNGTVLHYTHPWWQTHFCPNGWGCRCYITAVRADQYKGHPAPDDGTYEKTDSYGVTHVLPKGVDYGWDYAPGANRNAPFKEVIDQKLIRFPALIGADMWQALRPVLAMENRLSWYGVFDEWAADPVSRGRHHVVGAIHPDLLSAWQDLDKPLPYSAEIAVEDRLVIGAKQQRHENQQNGLLSSEWRRLPELLESPSAVFYDNTSGKIVYLLQADGAAMKGVVEMNYRVKQQEKRLNGLVSGYRQSDQQVDERVKRGDWIKLM